MHKSSNQLGSRTCNKSSKELGKKVGWKGSKELGKKVGWKGSKELGKKECKKLARISLTVLTFHNKAHNSAFE